MGLLLVELLLKSTTLVTLCFGGGHGRKVVEGK